MLVVVVVAVLVVCGSERAAVCSAYMVNCLVAIPSLE